MSRKTFLIVAGVLACLFGCLMMFAPERFLANLAVEHGRSAAVVTQWMGVALFAVGIVNVLARRDTGSVALRAVMIGNVVLHVAGLAWDIYDYFLGFVTEPGLLTGSIVHIALTLGFVYYLVMERSELRERERSLSV